MTRWKALGQTMVTADDPEPKVMGIVNATPDSFSDGGRYLSVSDAVEHGRRLIAEGASLLDIGGESSRPGSEPIGLDEELRRILPVVEGLVGAGAFLSVDTTKAEVARRVIAAGAAIVNDITAMSSDPEMVRIVADSGAGVVLMHMQGIPRTMQDAPHYDDVVAEVYEFLARRVEWAGSAGIPPDRIAIDPGIGFGKSMTHNLLLLRNLGRFATLGCTLLVGTSRKGFLGKITGRPVAERATASAVSALLAAADGARVVRVHDVGETVDAIRIWGDVRGWDRSETP